MMGVSVKAQRRPIFDNSEDLDKAYKLGRYMPVGRGKMQRTCMMPNITYDHAKRVVMKHSWKINATF